MMRPEPTAATPPAGGPPAIETRGLTNVYPHDITAVGRMGCDSEGEEPPTGAPLLVARARRGCGGQLVDAGAATVPHGCRNPGPRR